MGSSVVSCHNLLVTFSLRKKCVNNFSKLICNLSSYFRIFFF